MVSLAITVLLSLINIGSTVALNALVSLSVAAWLSAYMISLSCLILKRIRKEQLPHARWSLGRLGLPINIIALIFVIYIYVFSFFPSTSTVTLESMNWSVVIYGAAIIFSVAYYLLIGHKVYVGPVSITRRV